MLLMGNLYLFYITGDDCSKKYTAAPRNNMVSVYHQGYPCDRLALNLRAKTIISTSRYM